MRNTPDRLNSLIPWEDFRPLLERIRKPSQKGGRPPYDEIFMFRRLVLQELYGLSDEEVEYQTADRRVDKIAARCRQRGKIRAVFARKRRLRQRKPVGRERVRVSKGRVVHLCSGQFIGIGAGTGRDPPQKFSRVFRQSET